MKDAVAGGFGERQCLAKQLFGAVDVLTPQRFGGLTDADPRRKRWVVACEHQPLRVVLLGFGELALFKGDRSKRL